MDHSSAKRRNLYSNIGKTRGIPRINYFQKPFFTDFIIPRRDAVIFPRFATRLFSSLCTKNRRSAVLTRRYVKGFFGEDFPPGGKLPGPVKASAPDEASNPLKLCALRRHSHGEVSHPVELRNRESTSVRPPVPILRAGSFSPNDPLHSKFRQTF